MLSEGDFVWVLTGSGIHEEPATVVQLGVPLDEDSDDSPSSGKRVGVVVKFVTAGSEGTYHPSRVRKDPISMESTSGGRRARSSRSASIHAASTSTSAAAAATLQGESQTKESQTPPVQQLKSCAVITPSSVVTSSSTCATMGEASSSSSSEDKPLISLKKSDKRSAHQKQKASSKRRKMDHDGSSHSKKAKRKTKTIEKVKHQVILCQAATTTTTKTTTTASLPTIPNAHASDDMAVVIPGQPDGNGGLDQPSPFTVEYSKTGRATCRRCDQQIAKGALRIGHTPLFRGKPGFVVYRHLKCAVFDENVNRAEDVEGCSDLESDDYEKLALRVVESMDEIKREREELEPDELIPVVFQGETRTSPRGLVANLLPFQVEGASWMYHQEVKEDTIRGGILADEMGMGKTVQTITTMLDNRPKLQQSKPGAKYPPAADVDTLKSEEHLWNSSLSEWKYEMKMSNVPTYLLPKAKGNQSEGGARAGTLVVCPVIALSQWKTEIEKFTEGGQLTVIIYHGPNRSSKNAREMLRKYDVVLTTYQVLQADFRKMTSPNRVKCPNCGNKFKIDKLSIHLKYFCGEGAQRTEAQLRQRRNSDNNRERGGPPGGGGRGANSPGKSSGSGKVTATRTSKKESGKKSFTSGKVQKKKKTASRTKGKVDDIESDEEIASTSVSSSSRSKPSRLAALQAKKKLSESVNTWNEGANEVAGSNDEEYSDEGSVSSTSSEDNVARKKDARNISISNAESDHVSNSDSDSGSSLVIARQSKAWEAATKKGATKLRESKGSMKKTFASKKKPTLKRKNQGEKKANTNDSSSDSDDEIDMKKLTEEAMAGSQMSVLHSLCWWRIVLDEAHFIKTRSSQTAQAAFALIGIHKWCLSGTPLQNRVGEFYSLIRFLRLDPMAYYMCRNKNCDCKSLHYRMLQGRCQDCHHGSVQHFSYFNKYVLNPIQRDGYSGDGRRAMFVLKNEVLDKCLLRRTKQNRSEEMNLPPRIVTIRSVRLHPIEEDFYNALYTQTQSSFNDYIADGTLLNNYAHIFDLLMRMRQSVDHPYLVVYSKRNTDNKSSTSAGRAITNGTPDCELCHEPPTERVVSTCCQSAFCRTCVLDFMSGSASLHANVTPCPSCQAPFSLDLNQDQADLVDDSTLSVSRQTSSAVSNGTSSAGMPSLKELPHVATGSILRRINLMEFATSTKIEALTEELVMMRRSSPGSKAIVFSQFVNMLDLIRWRLHSDPCLGNMGLGARALHGGMDVKARDAVLKDFREDPSVRVLLMSLKAGGVALNLTIANHIYLMDPWWNPAAEMQAIDRTHRLGQYRPIRAVRFIAENTVEERILQLQEKKRLVFDGTVGRDAGSLKMLTVDDMKSLFA